MKPLLTRLALGVFGVSLGLIVVELIVRVSNLSPTVYRLGISSDHSVFQPSPNPLLGYTLKPNFRSSTKDCNHAFPFTNGHGQRDLERRFEREPGRARILLLGDSVVAGSGLCAFEKTLGAQLESALGSASHEVLNFGVPGYCTLAEVELLRTKGLQFRPDHVVVVYVWNDFVNANSAVHDASQNRRPQFVDDAFSESAAFRLVSLRLNLFGFRNEFTFDAAPNRAGPTISTANREMGVDRLSELSRKHGFDVTVVVWPYFWDESIEEGDTVSVVPERERIPVETLVERHGFSVIRLSAAFRADFEQRLQQKRRRRPTSARWTYTVGDGTHPNGMGTEIAARALAVRLRDADPAVRNEEKKIASGSPAD